MKLIIDIGKDYYEMIKQNVEHGQDYEYFKIIANGIPYEERQGEWLWLGDNPNPNHKWSCNKCGRGVKEQENFCPNCGAKMQKGGILGQPTLRFINGECDTICFQDKENTK